MKSKLFVHTLLTATAVVAWNLTPVYAQTSESPDQQSGQPGQSQQQDQQQMRARQTLGPHSIMVLSSTEAALDHLKGLQAQLNVSKTPGKQEVEHLRSHSREINDELKMAFNHQTQLQKSAQKFPEVSQGEDLQQLSSTFQNVRQFQKKWESRIGDRNYWSNQQQVQNDLSQLERSLNQVKERTQQFASSKLDLSTDIG